MGQQATKHTHSNETVLMENKENAPPTSTSSTSLSKKRITSGISDYGPTQPKLAKKDQIQMMDVGIVGKEDEKKVEKPKEEESRRVYPQHRFKVGTNIIEMLGGDPESLMAKLILSRVEVTSEEIKTTDHFSYSYFMDKTSRTPQDDPDAISQILNVAFLFLLKEFISETVGYRIIDWKFESYVKAFYHVFDSRENFTEFSRLAIQLTQGDRIEQICLMARNENVEKFLERLRRLKTNLYEKVNLEKLREGVEKYPKTFEKCE